MKNSSKKKYGKRIKRADIDDVADDLVSLIAYLSDEVARNMPSRGDYWRREATKILLKFRGLK